MRLRTPTDVNEALSSNLAWRKQELTALRLTMKRQQSQVFLRSWVALLYAHWEGFIKSSSRFYLEFVNNQRLTNRQLKSEFVAIAMKGKLRSASESNRIQLYLDVTKLFRERVDERWELSSDPVKGVGNVTSKVLKEIVQTLGLDFTPFETKLHLIDERLVDARNNVAHGELFEFDHDEVIELHDEILKMIEDFRTQLDNAASTGAYLA